MDMIVTPASAIQDEGHYQPEDNLCKPCAKERKDTNPMGWIGTRNQQKPRCKNLRRPFLWNSTFRSAMTIRLLPCGSNDAHRRVNPVKNEGCHGPWGQNRRQGKAIWEIYVIYLLNYQHTRRSQILCSSSHASPVTDCGAPCYRAA